MYFRILKKDLKRKKSMNVILLIFIMLAATFIASSANNMISVITALDTYFEMAEVPDYWFSTTDYNSKKRFEEFAHENGYDYKPLDLIMIDSNEIKLNGRKFEYSGSICISGLKNSIKVFDSSDNEITKVKDGEIYITSALFNEERYNFNISSKIQITIGDKTKDFILKGSTKDAEFGSESIGTTRFLVSENDFNYFHDKDTVIMNSINVYTDDSGYLEKFNNLELNTLFNLDKITLKKMYFMDMLIALVMLIVSVCLILISMVILRFTINFTMSEEFREIGVMKAIGIGNRKIRGLYIVKYFAISIVGASIGLVLSIPFGKMMMKDVSKNFIIPNQNNIILNLICAAGTAAVVVLFCYFCTRKIKNFSPIDAIRNGENGERYSRKSIISLKKFRLSPIIFMALNDIFSGLKRFIAMIVIFILGLLLIIIPENTINTLQSDSRITMFNMAECDHVISQELLFISNTDYKKVMNDKLDNIKKVLDEHNIEAEIFQEAMFRMTVSFNGKKESSLAFQGLGDVTTDMYAYLEGTAPQNNREIALSKLVADRIGAKIGDTVEVKNGEQIKEYIITATLQSMNNMGEGIRFYQDEELDYSYVSGCFGIQIKYTDSPDNDELYQRKALLREIDPDNKICTPGEYIGYMIGDVSGQIGNIRNLILLVVLCINILVTVLMVKSFIAKEKGELAMLKAIGFNNSSLMAWQTIRIGIILLISIILGTLLSTPLSKLTVEPIFKMMGAISIEFEIVPIKVYLLYPLILLVFTVLAAWITSFQLKKISAYEVSNIE